MQLVANINPEFLIAIFNVCAGFSYNLGGMRNWDFNRSAYTGTFFFFKDNVDHSGNIGIIFNTWIRDQFNLVNLIRFDLCYIFLVAENAINIKLNI